MGWKLNYMLNIMSHTFSEQCRDASIRQSTASGMFVSTIIPYGLEDSNDMSCWCVFQGTATVGGFQPQVCVPTQFINGQEHSIIGPMSFHILCSSESCRDGHATSGVCLYQPLRDRNTHHTSNGCALSRALSRWVITNLMCVPRYLRQSVNAGILNYTLNIMPCAWFSRTPSR